MGMDFGGFIPDRNGIYGTFYFFDKTKKIAPLCGFMFYQGMGDGSGKYEDYTRRFISDNICRVLCNLNISINRNMYFDYIFEKDFCKVVEIFIDQDPNYCSYNICAEKSISLMELAEMIRNIDGGNAQIIVKNEGLNPEYSGDNSRFINEFGKFQCQDF